jgi:GH43 family beta-xylosidase
MKNLTIAVIALASLVGCGGAEKQQAASSPVLDAAEQPMEILDTASLQSYVVEADIKLGGENSVAGFAFRAGDLVEAGFTGYYTGLSGADKTVFLLEDSSEMARRKVSVEPGQWYPLRLEVSGNNFVLYVDDNPVAENQFPKYDAVDDTYVQGQLALRVSRGQAEFRNVSVEPFERELPEVTYQNPVQAGCADPELMKYQNRFYAYCTYTPDFPQMVNGIRLYTSADLVNWQDQGYVLKNEDSWGESRFWAPDIVERDGTFYLYYAVDERIAVAQADSPMGPFRQVVQQPMMPDSIKIDAYVFEDDDGKRYFYYVSFDNGNHIWGAELNDDMMTIKPDTRKKLISPEEPWETHMANVAEGAVIIKREDTYYLTYSGSHFESPHYSVGYATAKHPLGPWTKYENNPIMKSTSYAHGTAHHSIVESPDGSELFIVYHQHNDLQTTEPRQMAIDRLQFIPQANGPDILEAWGPTMSHQPMPQ